MKLNELEHAVGAKTKSYRKGRGIGSGNGKNCGSGHKGQRSRSGGGVRPGFEGGQNPIYRRLPKFGFTHVSRKEFAIVNIENLNKFDENTIVTPALLCEVGLVKNKFDGIKILGQGKLTKSLTVQANKFSKSAESAIVAAGGKIEVI